MSQTVAEEQFKALLVTDFTLDRYQTNKDFSGGLSQKTAGEYIKKGLTSGEYPTLTGKDKSEASLYY